MLMRLDCGHSSDTSSLCHTVCQQQAPRPHGDDDADDDDGDGEDDDGDDPTLLPVYCVSSLSPMMIMMMILHSSMCIFITTNPALDIIAISNNNHDGDLWDLSSSQFSTRSTPSGQL